MVLLVTLSFVSSSSSTIDWSSSLTNWIFHCKWTFLWTKMFNRSSMFNGNIQPTFSSLSSIRRSSTTSTWTILSIELCFFYLCSLLRKIFFHQSSTKTYFLCSLQLWFVESFSCLFFIHSFHWLCRLPWQHARRFRSIIFQSYTLIGISFVPCQELCTSVRHCAGIQFQVNRTLSMSNDFERWSRHVVYVTIDVIYYVQLNHGIFFQVDVGQSMQNVHVMFKFKKTICSFVIIIRYVILSISVKVISTFIIDGKTRVEGSLCRSSRKNQAMIHRLTHISETQCQYLCSKIVSCIVRRSIVVLFKLQASIFSGSWNRRQTFA